MRLMSLSILVASVLAPQEAEKVALEWKLKKGDAFRYEFTMKNEMSAAGMDNRQEMIMGQQFDVTEVTDEGLATLKVTYDRARFKMEGAMPVDFDSDKDKKPEGLFPMIFGGMVGKSFTMQMGKKGDVAKVEGMAKMIDDIAKDLPEEHQAMAGMMKGGMTDEQTKLMFQNTLGILPKGPIAKGESWDVSMKSMFGGAGAAAVKGKGTLKEVRDGKEALVKYEFTVEVGGDEEGGEPVKSDVDLVWDLEQGRLKSTKSTTKSSAGGMGEATMSMEMKLAPRDKPPAK
jgi:hypothetical protein